MTQDWAKVKKTGCENKGWEKEKKPRLQTGMRWKQKPGTETEKWEVENALGRNEAENRRQMDREWKMKIKLVFLLFKGRIAAWALGNTQGQIINETEN